MFISIGVIIIFVLIANSLHKQNTLLKSQLEEYEEYFIKVTGRTLEQFISEEDDNSI